MPAKDRLNTRMSASLSSGRNVRWPRRMLPLVNHGEYVDGTDRPIDASPLNYSFRSGRGQSNKID